MNMPMRGVARVLVLSVIGLVLVVLGVGGWLAQGRLAIHAENALVTALKSKALRLSSHGKTDLNPFTTPQVSFHQLELRELGEARPAPAAVIERVGVGVAGR